MQEVIILLAKYFYLVAVILALAAWWMAEHAARVAILKLAIIALPLSLIAGKLAGKLFYNARPFVVNHTTPLIPHDATNGFPSDHTLLVMTLAAILFAYDRRAGVVLFVCGVIVGGARVYAQVHHPLDVIGATVIAFVATAVAYVVVRQVPIVDQLLTRLLAIVKLA